MSGCHRCGALRHQIALDRAEMRRLANILARSVGGRHEARNAPPLNAAILRLKKQIASTDVILGRHQFEDCTTSKAPPAARATLLGQALLTACATCGTTTIGKTAWAKRGQLERDALKRQGIAMRRGGQCSPCYTREVWAGQAAANADERRRETVTRDILAAEWEHLHDRHLTIAENCRRIAPRIGMRWRTMEKALYRTGIVGRAA